MRLDRLDLISFGGFSDTSLELSGPSFHVVYGPNEAGKTTARAALSNLLYDFELRSTYAFVHPLSKLALGGVLRDEGSTTLEVIRYKRNKDPLVEAVSGQPVSPARWAGLLQAVSRADFEALYTLGCKELLEGTAELVARGGALGETLFAAGLGVRMLGAVLDGLDAEAGELFSPRASTKVVNAALRTVNEARRRAAELSLRPSHYAEIDRDHDRAVESCTELATERRLLEQDQLRRVTLRGVLPSLHERAAALEERDRLALQGPLAPSTWAERVAQALEARTELTARRGIAEERLRSILASLEVAVVEEPLLAGGARVDALAEGISGYLDGRNDRGGLDEGRRDAEREALRLLETLMGRPVELDDLDVAPAVLAGKERFGRARDRWAAERLALERVVDELDAAQLELSEVVASLSEAPDPIDPAPLRSAIDDATSEGDLDATLTAAQLALRTATEARDELAGRLSLGSGEIADALARPAPSPEEVESILATLDRLAADARAAAERAAAAEARAAELDGLLAALAAEGALPSEEDLEMQRSTRDSLWSSVRAAWLRPGQAASDSSRRGDLIVASRSDGSPPSSSVTGQEELAAAYEASVVDADETADRLWREADRTARRRALATELDRVRAEHLAASGASARLVADAAAAYQLWRDGWPGQRLPGVAGGLRQWATQIEQLRTLQHGWSAARLQHRQVFMRRRALMVQLAAEVHRAAARPEQAVSVGGGLGPVLGRARRRLAELDRHAARLEELTERRSALEHRLALGHVARRRAEAAEAGAAGELRSLLGPYGAAIGSLEDASLVLSRLDQLDRLVVTRAERLHRIAGIDRRSLEFETELAALVAVVPELGDLPASDAARQLVLRVKAARDADAKRQALLEERDDARSALEAATIELAGVRDGLAELAREVSIDLIDDLETTAARSSRVAALDEQIRSVETRLSTQGGGRSLAELEADAVGCDPLELGAAIDAGQAALAVLAEKLEQATRTEAELAQELRSMDGSDAAAAEVDRAEAALALALEGAERFTRVVLARHLAAEVVRRYAEQHRDPLLERAGGHLAQLTSGAWLKVGVVHDDHRTPRLSAIAAGGEERFVGQLSDGTRDQLYFALRLAAIEEAIGHRGAMPVVFDDILVNFDDDRSRAAIGCLAALAETTQVLVFTHHHHVASLVDEVLGTERARLHELPAGATGLTRRSRSQDKLSN